MVWYAVFGFQIEIYRVFRFWVIFRTVFRFFYRPERPPLFGLNKRKQIHDRPRQSWSLDSTPWIPDFRNWISSQRKQPTEASRNVGCFQATGFRTPQAKFFRITMRLSQFCYYLSEHYFKSTMYSLCHK